MYIILESALPAAVFGGLRVKGVYVHNITCITGVSNSE